MFAGAGVAQPPAALQRPEPSRGTAGTAIIQTPPPLLGEEGGHSSLIFEWKQPRFESLL